MATPTTRGIDVVTDGKVNFIAANKKINIEP
jgi:hypothetical protein